MISSVGFQISIAQNENEYKSSERVTLLTRNNLGRLSISIGIQWILIHL